MHRKSLIIAAVDRSARHVISVDRNGSQPSDVTQLYDRLNRQRRGGRWRSKRSAIEIDFLMRKNLYNVNRHWALMCWIGCQGYCIACYNHYGEVEVAIHNNKQFYRVYRRRDSEPQYDDIFRLKMSLPTVIHNVLWRWIGSSWQATVLRVECTRNRINWPDFCSWFQICLLNDCDSIPIYRIRASRETNVFILSSCMAAKRIKREYI